MTGRKPVMIVECKAPDIPLEEKVFEQIVTYNMKYQGSVSSSNKRYEALCLQIQ